MDSSPSYHGYPSPAEIIPHCVWLYFRFCLSVRHVQEMMLERGVKGLARTHLVVEARGFGAQYAPAAKTPQSL
jgi:putative transposase